MFADQLGRHAKGIGSRAKRPEIDRLHKYRHTRQSIH
jgi:hypothetical protein